MSGLASTIRTASRPVLAGAAIYSFAFAPLARFADPGAVWGAGAVLAAGLFVLLLEGEDGGSWRRVAFGAAIAALGFLTLSRTGDIARMDAAANDRRCIAIQRDMLSAHPRRSDSPDLFQALGCRPQGEGSVYAPKPAIPVAEKRGKPMQQIGR